MPGLTQAALYGDIDLELSWSEEQLPQRERTKHVHALHPYLGKFVPQLAEALLRRHLMPGESVLDPFCGSGTTLVEATALGIDSTGCEISPFNALLTREKLVRHPPFELEHGLRDVLARAEALSASPTYVPSAPAYMLRWHSPRAQRELCAYRDTLVEEGPLRGIASIVLSRAARSARLVPHFDLDNAVTPVAGPYYCHKHKRTCHPTAEAARFLRRYTDDSIVRLRAFDAVRRPATWRVVHGDARAASLGGPYDAVVTSPPYVGVIDYHGQHAYAYALLDLCEHHDEEIGSRRRGRTNPAVAAYVDDMAAALANAGRSLRRGAPVVIVVNDRLDLYSEILTRSNLNLESRSRRHVNRRTSRRAGEYFEEILIARVP